MNGDLVEDPVIPVHKLRINAGKTCPRTSFLPQQLRSQLLSVGLRDATGGLAFKLSTSDNPGTSSPVPIVREVINPEAFCTAVPRLALWTWWTRPTSSTSTNTGELKNEDRMRDELALKERRVVSARLGTEQAASFWTETLISHKRVLTPSTLDEVKSVNLPPLSPLSTSNLTPYSQAS